MSIRVGKQDPKTHLLRDVLIYDNRNINGNMTTTVADSGYIRLSDDKEIPARHALQWRDLRADAQLPVVQQKRAAPSHLREAGRRHPHGGFRFRTLGRQLLEPEHDQEHRPARPGDRLAGADGQFGHHTLLRTAAQGADLRQRQPGAAPARQCTHRQSGFRDALIADSIARLGLRDRDKVGASHAPTPRTRAASSLSTNRRPRRRSTSSTAARSSGTARFRCRSRS